MSKPSDWLRSGTGLPPRIAWAFATDAELSDLSYARESGDLFAVDASGALYRLSRSGRIRALSRSLRNATFSCWSDSGTTGVALSDGDRFSVLDANLNIVWSSQSPSPVVCAAIDPFGHNILISMETRSNAIINVDKRKLAQFATLRPVRFSSFVSTRPAVVTVAEGEFTCHDMNGNPLWESKLFGNVGDMSVTGDAKSILLAQYSHGIQAYDEQGESQAAFVVEGAPSKVSVAYYGDRLVVATTERHLYWLDADGALLWAAETPEPVRELVCDPLGEWLIVGFQSGRILRLDWESQQ